jgi:hypothetical protein
MKRYQALARAADWRTRNHNAAQDRIDELMQHAPSGSGFDAGTQLDEDSTEEKLIFNTSFHHMDEGGGYDGWTDHKVRVTPSLSQDVRIAVTGRNRNYIKEYIHETFMDWLTEDESQV